MGKVKKVTGIDVAAPVKAVQSGIRAIQNAPGISAISKAATDVLQPVEKAVLQPINRGLVSLDKAVGSAIPGGWGTLGTIAASMIPGGQFAALGLSKTAAMTGLGALTGSGVLRPGRGFNLQGAIAGGAMAYGASKLADYAAAAGNADKVASTVDKYGNLAQPEYVPSEYLRGTSIGPDAALSSQTPVSSSILATPDAQISLARPITEPGIRIPTAGSSNVGLGGYAPSQGFLERAGNYVSNIPGKVGDYVSNLPSKISEGASGAYDSLANFADKATTPSTYSDFGSSYAKNVSDIGSGIKNLITNPGAAKAATAATGINPIGAAGATLYGATGLMALNEQEKLLNEQLANQQIAQAEYDQALGEINRQRDYAAKMVRENPFRLAPTDTSIGDTLYGRTDADRNLYARAPTSRNTLYAQGGEVKGYLGGGLLSGIRAALNKISPTPTSTPTPTPATIGTIASSSNISPSVLEALGSNLYERGFDKNKINSPVSIQISGGGGVFGGIGGIPTVKSNIPYLGETLYEREIKPTESTNFGGFGLGNLNKALRGFFAAGGQVDDELGGDYTAIGMDQGNLQKGLFGMGYKEGGVTRKPVSYKNMDIRDEFGIPTGRSVQELEGSLPIDDAYLIARLRAMRGIPNEGIVEQGIGANIPVGQSRLNAMVNQDRMMNRRYELGGSTPFFGGELSGMMSKTEGRDPIFNVGYRKRFAEGGTPRFLSGGGDGMSDSIPATIEGKQEARLADGEFVIPADVVSHLGNGSSKAGAKQLYAMMDKVRQARTGRKSQGKQINPRKYMPA